MSVAKSVVFKLGTFAVPATPTDISAKLSSVKPSWSTDSHESTTFGASGSKSKQAGLNDGTISIEGNWDATIHAQFMALRGFDNGGTGIAFEHGPEGSATGKLKTTGNVILTKYDPPSNVGQVNKFTAELDVTGALTETTY